MMGRVFWFAAGAAATVYVRTRLRRAVDRVTPHGLADQVSAARAGLRLFADEVQAGMADRERQLRESLGVDDATFRRMLLAEVKPPRPHKDIA